MGIRSSPLGRVSAPVASSRASISARRASSSSRPATTRCSASSGEALPAAVTSRQTGQKPTVQVMPGWAPGAGEDAGSPAGAPEPSPAAGAEPRPALPRRRPPARRGGSSGARPQPPAEPPSPAACTAGARVNRTSRRSSTNDASCDVEALQHLGQDQVPLVRADPDEELVTLAEHVEVGAVDERQVHRQHVHRRPACAPGSAPRGAGCRWRPASPYTSSPISARSGMPDHLPVEQAGGEDRDRRERLPDRRQVLGLDVLPLAEVGVVDLVGDDAVDDDRVHPVAEQRQVRVGAPGLGDHHLLGVHHQPDARHAGRWSAAGARRRGSGAGARSPRRSGRRRWAST